MRLLQQKDKVFELNCMLTFDYVLKCEVDTFSEDKQLFMITQFVMQWIMKIFRDTKFDYGINGYASPT